MEALLAFMAYTLRSPSVEFSTRFGESQRNVGSVFLAGKIPFCSNEVQLFPQLLSHTYEEMLKAVSERSKREATTL